MPQSEKVMMVKYCKCEDELVAAEKEAAEKGRKLKPIFLCAACNAAGNGRVIDMIWKVLVGGYFLCLKHFRSYVGRHREEFRLKEENVDNFIVMKLVTPSRFHDLYLLKDEPHPDL